MANFDEAQQAAATGNYREVVAILSTMLLEDELDAEQQVVAYANRGIAYSLLNAYALAKQDLEIALSMNPNHPLTLNQLGLLAEQVDQDYVLAAGFYQKAIEQRFAASQVNLANLYWFGKGVPRNSKRAFELYRQAAEANYNMAFAPLGRIYASGDGAPQNHKRAFALFEKAAESGVTSANYHLGFAYEKGRGVKQDLALAKRNYQIAAIQGHGEAQNALGYLYRRGVGVEQDYVRAATWYQLAADQGVPGAMNRLAWLLAACPVEKVCNGEAAIVLAKQAIDNGATPERFDSLAAAYARVGQFDEAIEVMNKVLAMLPQDSKKRAAYETRLEQYRQGIVTQL
tara:strand:+ start:41973 stop:43001 length:1029 start_codon:yes stop_codon:yes gene_type:complete